MGYAISWVLKKTVHVSLSPSLCHATKIPFVTHRLSQDTASPILHEALFPLQTPVLLQQPSERLLKSRPGSRPKVVGSHWSAPERCAAGHHCLCYIFRGSSLPGPDSSERMPPGIHLPPFPAAFPAGHPGHPVHSDIASIFPAPTCITCHCLLPELVRCASLSSRTVRPLSLVFFWFCPSTTFVY